MKKKAAGVERNGCQLSETFSL